jgi:DNA-binding transcriptional ArsR family regulator
VSRRRADLARPTNLARQAIARHQLRGEPLEDSIAWAIRQALTEAADPASLAPMPPAAAAIVALLQDHRRLTPTKIAKLRGTSWDAASFAIRRLVVAGVVKRVRHGTYALAPNWKRNAAAMVDRWHEGLSRGGLKAAVVKHARARRSA